MNSHTSTIGRVRWKIPGKSKVLISKTKKNHVGAKEQVHMQLPMYIWLLQLFLVGGFNPSEKY